MTKAFFKREAGLAPPSVASRQVILASASRARTALLANAGVAHSVAPSAVDEDALRRSMLKDGAAPRDMALALAEAKALDISAAAPGALVIGADQLLVRDGAIVDKPKSLEAAAGQLRQLRGRRHDLITSVCLAEAARVTWRHTEVARLEMRQLSDQFIADYLSAGGTALLSSVGAYQLEGLGGQLFSRVEGDYFSILGLPLLPLLAILRERGAMAS